MYLIYGHKGFSALEPFINVEALHMLCKSATHVQNDTSKSSLVSSTIFSEGTQSGHILHYRSQMKWVQVIPIQLSDSA